MAEKLPVYQVTVVIELPAYDSSDAWEDANAIMESASFETATYKIGDVLRKD